MSSSPNPHPSVQLHSLACWLDVHRALWQPRAFAEQPLPWEADLPEVSRWLRALDDDRIDALEPATKGFSEAPDALRVLAEKAGELARLPRLEPPPLPTPPARLRAHIPLRKWQQIVAFAPLLQHPKGSAGIIEWCGGKGHLGRLLAWANNCPVIHLERQRGLATRAAELDRAAAIQGSALVCDVLDPSVQELLGPGIGAVGLHACGVLNDALLEGGARQGAECVVAATCCYQVLPQGQNHYRPRSAAGRDRDLHLDRHQLKLAIYDEVVAPARIRRARRREMAYRAAFDLLHRESTGVQTYTPLGNLPPGIFRAGFRAFCEEVVERRGLALPARFAAEQALAAGSDWARRARALGLVRALFRRPLETWLFLDRVCRQHELGRRVDYGTFCDRRTTPRNLALVSLPL